MDSYRYRVAPLQCPRSATWYAARGDNIREALTAECKSVTIDGDPVRVEVEGHGFWWLSAETTITYYARPEVKNA